MTTRPRAWILSRMHGLGIGGIYWSFWIWIMHGIFSCGVERSGIESIGIQKAIFSKLPDGVVGRLVLGATALRYPDDHVC